MSEVIQTNNVDFLSCKNNTRMFPCDRYSFSIKGKLNNVGKRIGKFINTLGRFHLDWQLQIHINLQNSI